MTSARTGTRESPKVTHKRRQTHEGLLNSRTFWCSPCELNLLRGERFAAARRVRLTVHWVVFSLSYISAAGNWEAAAELKQKFVLARGLQLCRNVAERKTHVLPSGSEQDRLGGSGALSEPLSSRLRRIRICVVNVFMFFFKGRKEECSIHSCRPSRVAALLANLASSRRVQCLKSSWGNRFLRGFIYIYIVSDCWLHVLDYYY